MDSNKIRLQKVIADSGLMSRREAEKLIQEGRVTINDAIAQIGDKVDPSVDKISVNGKPLRLKSPEKIAIAINKPKGYICTNRDDFGGKTIFDLLPSDFRKMKLFCAGRLDKESQGLVIITNDGDFAHQIMHPSFNILKKYRVKISKELDPKIIPKLLKGIKIDGEHLFFNKIIPLTKKSDNKEIEIHLTQGRKREIRRLFEAFGYFVENLKRFQIGGYILRGIPFGGIKILGQKDLSLLLKKS